MRIAVPPPAAVISLGGRARRALRRAVERWSHPRRRRAVHELLRGRPAPRHVLVVCHGNIWRSPYGEALLRRELAAHEWRTVAVSSAGFIGPGRPSPKLAVQLAGLRGIDLTPHRSRVIMPADVDRADLILVMNLAQGRAVRALGRGDGPPIVILGDLDPEAIETREIPDPYGQTRELSERSYARIDRCISALVDVLVTASPALAHAGAES